MAKLQLPTDPVLAEKVMEHNSQIDKRNQERGLMGRLFGIGKEKPGNIAAFALIIFSLMFCAVLFGGTDTTSLSKKDELVLIASFVTTTLGFLFGRASA